MRRLDPIAAGSGLFLALAVLLGATVAPADPIRFHSTTQGPASFAEIVAGDFDGDGDPDIAGIGSNGQLKWVTNAGGALMSLAVVNGVDVLKGVAAGDLNGDGRSDLVACANGLPNGNIVVHLATAGGFSGPVYVPTGTTNVSDIQVGDLDGDGDLDVAAVDGSTMRSLRLFNDGAGNLSGLATTALGQPRERLRLVDLTGDGKLDLLFARPVGVPQLTTDSAYVQVNSGGGAFAPPINAGVRGIHAVAEFGGGTGPDAYVRDSGQLRGIARGRGDGTFDPPVFTNFTNFTSDGWWSEPIDVDRDGRFELMYPASDTRGFNRLLRVRNDLTLDPSEPTGLGRVYFTTLVVDLDGDGWDDVVTQELLIFGNRHGRLGGVRVLSKYEGVYPDTWFEDVQDVDVGDVTGDGHPDVVVSSRYYAAPMFAGRGDGTFLPPVPFQPQSYIRACELADLDLDGDLDFASYHNDPGLPNHIYWGLNDGTGALTYNMIGTGGVYGGGVTVTDFDGDGDPDILSARSSPAPEVVSLYLNDGAGHFGAGQPCSLPMRRTYYDLNGDGLPELLGATGDSLEIQYATGVGTLGPVLRTYAGGIVESAEFLDVTGDGVRDAVLLFTNDQLVTRVGLAGGGWGVTIPAASAVVPAGPATLGSVGDLDGDGLPDVLIAGQNVICALRNLGGGRFGDRGDTYTTQPFGTLIADVDHDGAGDLVGTAVAGGSMGSDGITILYGIPSRGTPTAVLVSNVSAEGLTDRARLVWQLGGDVVARATIERRDEAQGWETIASVLPESDARIVYDDLAVTPGTRYGYRLLIAGEASPLGEVWVTIPAVAAFGIERVWPNPATSERLSVRFAVEKGGPVAVELIDVSGRRIESRQIVAPAPGSHVIELASGRRLEPGLYLVRVHQGERRAQTKIALVR